ncbi:hypothetical protein CLOSTHATH_00011 [Hungatella hathewayi DSM 13479]|uniref:Uncharacterized protein n=1 Tax=Hungatella hathewayi DSM 13479 TaxID=566550 RepID=D3A8U8_9FIRM|nr:hypothetical protein CLOSTHATH_00011 [Hungatella hathewayi DSM 13479]
MSSGSCSIKKSIAGGGMEGNRENICIWNRMENFGDPFYC